MLDSLRPLLETLLYPYCLMLNNMGSIEVEALILLAVQAAATMLVY